MSVFSAADIVGKTLVARKTIPVYSLPMANAQYKIGTVQKGNSAGVVYSYLSRPDGIWWQFIPTFGKPYYIRHDNNAFDVSALKQQGVITVEDQRQQEEREKMSWWEKLQADLSAAGQNTRSAILKGVIIAGGIYLAKETIQALIRYKK